MPLRRRRALGAPGLRLPLLLPLLGCALLLLALLPPAPQPPPRARAAPARAPGAAASYRLDFAGPQEWELEAEDEGREYGPLDGLPPLGSLREDQLLVAVASPRARRNQSQAWRAGGYRLIRQPRRRQHAGTPARARSAEENGEAPHEDQQSRLRLDPRGLAEAISARAPLRRAVPGGRHPLCERQQPGDSLPTASVILCFHDEAWSPLLRTVHGILDTAPRALLKELILVDDLSQQGELRSALSDHVARLQGVKLIRSNRRLGAIGGRVLGATRATGDVLVFVDAPCECHPGWLEPLLSRIAGDRSRVVSPVIDAIDWKTLQPYPSEGLQRGVLDWKLDFHWEPLPEKERKALPSAISPVRSPVVPGGVVAVDRHYFQDTGAYDPLMSLQGGENLELSLKEAILRNKVRIAETWLGSFKETFYRHSPEAFSLAKAEKPDCTERLQLQRRLGCRAFHWFLANVYPELYPSERGPTFSGKLHNTGLGFCVDCRADGNALGCPVTLAPCRDSRQQQHLQHSSRKEIRVGGPQQLCLDVRREQVVLWNCTRESAAPHPQHWDFQQNGMIIHFLTGKCMEAVVQEDSKDIYLRQCDGKASQLWRFDQVNTVDER